MSVTYSKYSVPYLISVDENKFVYVAQTINNLTMIPLGIHLNPDENITKIVTAYDVIVILTNEKNMYICNGIEKRISIPHVKNIKKYPESDKNNPDIFQDSFYSDDSEDTDESEYDRSIDSDDSEYDPSTDSENDHINSHNNNSQNCISKYMADVIYKNIGAYPMRAHTYNCELLSGIITDVVIYHSSLFFLIEKKLYFIQLDNNNVFMQLTTIKKNMDGVKFVEIIFPSSVKDISLNNNHIYVYSSNNYVYALRVVPLLFDSKMIYKITYDYFKSAVVGIDAFFVSPETSQRYYIVSNNSVKTITENGQILNKNIIDTVIIPSSRGIYCLYLRYTDQGSYIRTEYSQKGTMIIEDEIFLANSDDTAEFIHKMYDFYYLSGTYFIISCAETPNDANKGSICMISDIDTEYIQFGYDHVAIYKNNMITLYLLNAKYNWNKPLYKHKLNPETFNTLLKFNIYYNAYGRNIKYIHVSDISILVFLDDNTVENIFPLSKIKYNFMDFPLTAKSERDPDIMKIKFKLKPSDALHIFDKPGLCDLVKIVYMNSNSGCSEYKFILHDYDNTIIATGDGIRRDIFSSAANEFYLKYLITENNMVKYTDSIYKLKKIELISMGYILRIAAIDGINFNLPLSLLLAITGRKNLTEEEKSYYGNNDQEMKEFIYKSEYTHRIKNKINNILDINPSQIDLDIAYGFNDIDKTIPDAKYHNIPIYLLENSITLDATINWSKLKPYIKFVGAHNHFYIIEEIIKSMTSEELYTLIKNWTGGYNYTDRILKVKLSDSMNNVGIKFMTCFYELLINKNLLDIKPDKDLIKILLLSSNDQMSD